MCAAALEVQRESAISAFESAIAKYPLRPRRWLAYRRQLAARSAMAAGAVSVPRWGEKTVGDVERCCLRIEFGI